MIRPVIVGVAAGVGRRGGGPAGGLGKGLQDPGVEGPEASVPPWAGRTGGGRGGGPRHKQPPEGTVGVSVPTDVSFPRGRGHVCGFFGVLFFEASAVLKNHEMPKRL